MHRVDVDARRAVECLRAADRVLSRIADAWRRLAIAGDVRGLVTSAIASEPPPPPVVVPPDFGEAFAVRGDFDAARAALDASSHWFAEALRGRLDCLESRFADGVARYRLAAELARRDACSTLDAGRLVVLGAFLAEDIRGLDVRVRSAPLPRRSRLSGPLAPFRPYLDRCRAAEAERRGDLLEADRRCRLAASDPSISWGVRAGILARRASLAVRAGDEAEAVRLLEAAEVAAAGADTPAHRGLLASSIAGVWAALDADRAAEWRAALDVLDGLAPSGRAAFARRADRLVAAAAEGDCVAV